MKKMKILFEIFIRNYSKKNWIKWSKKVKDEDESQIIIRSLKIWKDEMIVGLSRFWFIFGGMPPVNDFC